MVVGGGPRRGQLVAAQQPNPEVPLLHSRIATLEPAPPSDRRTDIVGRNNLGCNAVRAGGGCTLRKGSPQNC